MTQTSDPASSNSVYDLVVIGAGPGGYVAAIRAAQLGLKTAVVEKGWWGGVCLNVGCIPSKAMLDSSERFYEARTKLANHGIVIKDLSLDLPKLLARKDSVVKGLTTGVQFLLKKNKVDAHQGTARLAAADTVEVKAADGSTKQLKTKRVLIATGSVPTELPGLPFDGKFVVTSTEALAFTEVPKKLVVVGGGYIGVEMGSVWARLGSEVTVIEFTDRILPLMDQELSGQLQRSLEKQGLKFVFGAGAQKAEPKGKEVVVTYKVGDKVETITADKCLVCTGRRPLTAGLGLEQLGVQMEKGFIKIDHHFQTNVPGVFAIGDVVGGLMLAHKAEEEGMAAVELMAGKAGHVNYKTVPGIVYTHPELAQVGLTEADAKREG
ncbi:MAG TPA: dihydrolipoyl dehydrogenase, partial [Humisphaera sp.]